MPSVNNNSVEAFRKSKTFLRGRCGIDGAVIEIANYIARAKYWLLTGRCRLVRGWGLNGCNIKRKCLALERWHFEWDYWFVFPK